MRSRALGGNPSERECFVMPPVPPVALAGGASKLGTVVPRGKRVVVEMLDRHAWFRVRRRIVQRTIRLWKRSATRSSFKKYLGSRVNDFRGLVDGNTIPEETILMMRSC